MNPSSARASLYTIIAAGVVSAIALACADSRIVDGPEVAAASRTVPTEQQIVLTAVPDPNAEAGPPRQVAVTLRPVLEGEPVPELPPPPLRSQ